MSDIDAELDAILTGVAPAPAGTPSLTTTTIEDGPTFTITTQPADEVAATDIPLPAAPAPVIAAEPAAPVVAAPIVSIPAGHTATKRARKAAKPKVSDPATDEDDDDGEDDDELAADLRKEFPHLGAQTITELAAGRRRLAEHTGRGPAKE